MWTTRSLCLLALLAAALLAPGPARAAGPSLAPNTPGVSAGDVITFAGEGFAPRERIAIWATAPDQAVLDGDRVSADGEGRAMISFRIPAGAIGGAWAMTAYGLASRAPAVAHFEVAGRGGESAELLAAAAPESGPPGSTFAFAATGFDRDERVSYWFTAPDGSVFAAFSQHAKANRDGRVDISWASPADAPRGSWVVTIQGVKSGVARGIGFQVQ
jgi:hypothetical protein